MSRLACLLIGMALASAAVAQAPPAPLSGRAFQSPATQALEDDELLNAGMLWVEQGARLWTVPGTGGACAACHGDAAQTMRGVAARHPRVDPASGALFNLERRINTCRTVRQREPAWPFESEPLLALTAYVAHLSKGLPRNVAVDGAARPYFEAGRAFFETRQGQLNLACSQCHQDYAGRKLRGDTISQGQTDGWPAYRLEWQTLGSLQRRLRACSLGVRAEVLPFDAPEYVALELYLAWRGQRLPISAPGVRR